MPGRVVFSEEWLADYRQKFSARLVPRVPASPAPLAGRGGEPGCNPVDSQNASAAASAVNAGRGRSGSRRSGDVDVPRQPLQAPYNGTDLCHLNPVAGGGVEASGYSGRKEPGKRLVEPNLGGADHAADRSLAAGGNRRRGAQSPAPGGCPGTTNKYRAVRTEGLGPNGERRVYDSKAEARFARELNSERSAGLIVSWVPQVSFPLGPDEKGRDVRYRADALVILEVRPDGTFLGRFADKKGRDTPNSRTKRATARALYSIDVKVI